MDLLSLCLSAETGNDRDGSALQIKESNICWI